MTNPKDIIEDLSREHVEKEEFLIRLFFGERSSLLWHETRKRTETFAHRKHSYFLQKLIKYGRCRAGVGNHSSLSKRIPDLPVQS